MDEQQQLIEEIRLLRKLLEEQSAERAKAEEWRKIREAIEKHFPPTTTPVPWYPAPMPVPLPYKPWEPWIVYTTTDNPPPQLT